MKYLAQTNLPGYVTDQPAGNFFGTKGGAGGVGDTGFYKFFAPDWWLGSLGKTIERIVLFAIIVSGLIFFLKLLASGLAYMTNAGDANKIQTATKEITNAVIGLLIVISTFFLAQIIQVIFGIKII